MSAKEFPIHPVAKLLPAMQAGDFKKLKDSIKEHGQQESIKMWGGQVMDGRHRLKACQELDIAPKIEQMSGTEAEAVAVAFEMNIGRRHLDQSQKAIAIAKYATLTKGRQENEDKPAKGKDKKPKAKSMSVKAAAKKAGVSTATVERAKKVRKNAIPAIVEMVEAGEMTVNEAAKIAKKAPDKQVEILKDIKKGETTSKAVEKSEKAEKKASGVLDDRRRKVPVELEEVFITTLYEQIANSARATKKLLDELDKHPSSATRQTGNLQSFCQSIITAMEQEKPAAVCPACEGEAQRKKDCPTCTSAGYFTHSGQKKVDWNNFKTA